MLNKNQLEKIDRLVKKVGDFQIHKQLRVVSSDIEEKSLNQLVSFVDIDSENMLVDGLSKITPSAGFLTEENTITQQNDKLYWIIDPLDGTTNYLFGHSKYSISLALYQNKKPVLSLIHI